MAKASVSWKSNEYGSTDIVKHYFNDSGESKAASETRLKSWKDIDGTTPLASSWCFTPSFLRIANLVAMCCSQFGHGM